MAVCCNIVNYRFTIPYLFSCEDDYKKKQVKIICSKYKIEAV